MILFWTINGGEGFRQLSDIETHIKSRWGYGRWTEKVTMVAPWKAASKGTVSTLATAITNKPTTLAAISSHSHFTFISAITNTSSTGCHREHSSPRPGQFQTNYCVEPGLRVRGRPHQVPLLLFFLVIVVLIIYRRAWSPFAFFSFEQPYSFLFLGHFSLSL